MFVALIVFMAIAVVAEAFVMLLMKYNVAGKALLDSFIVNIASLIVGYLLYGITGSLFYITDSLILNWLLLYALTVLVEFCILNWLSRSRPRNKTLATSAMTNVASYLILYIFVGG